MIEELTSIFSSQYQLYFKNGDVHPAGDLLMAGIGRPGPRNNWQDTRNMWSYPYYTLNVILGKGNAFYQNEKGFNCDLSHGDMMITFPGIKQHYAPALGGHWGELFISFAGESFDVLLRNAGITPHQPVWHLVNPHTWTQRLQSFLQETPPSTATGKLRRAALFQYYLLRMLEEARPVTAQESNSYWLAIACNLLTNDLHHKVDLHAIADELEMSYHTFRLYFKQHAGISPMKYREKARIQAACEYFNNNPIKKCREVAFDLGYSSVQYFSEQFKRYMGLSPQEYRRKR